MQHPTAAEEESRHIEGFQPHVSRGDTKAAAEEENGGY